MFLQLQSTNLHLVVLLLLLHIQLLLLHQAINPKLPQEDLLHQVDIQLLLHLVGQAMEPQQEQALLQLHTQVRDICHLLRLTREEDSTMDSLEEILNEN